MTTRFGLQPARDILYIHRWTIRRAAKELGVTYQHLSKALRGYHSPCPELREGLPVLLNCPLDELFTAEVIAQPFASKKDRHLVGAK